VQVVWRSQALADIADLRDYIARDNPAAADQTARRVREAVTRLATFPHQGRQGRRVGTRELIVAGTPYLVVYRVREASVRVLRVLHAKRRWP
jgi:addiction module RelE/StbE family toxin